MARDRQRAKQRRARQGGRPAARSKSPSRQSTPLGPERRSTVDPPEPTDEISGDAELAKQSARGAPTDDVDHPVDDPDPDPDPDTKAEVFADELSDGAAGGGVLSELAGDEEREVSDEDASPEEPVFPDPATTGGGGGKRGGGGGKRGDDADGGGGGGRKAEGTPASRPKREPATRSEGNRVIAFLRACWAELQRVQWPDRRAVAQATAVVLGFVVIAGSFLGLMDFVWQKVVTALLDL